MFAQKKIWSERVGKHGPWITSKDYQNFMFKWITDSTNIQRMRIYAILIDKVPIAMKLASYSVSHLDLIIAAFHSDPQYAKYSPGFVLDEFWMKIVFEKRLNVDFGAGNEALQVVLVEKRQKRPRKLSYPANVDRKHGHAIVAPEARDDRTPGRASEATN